MKRTVAASLFLVASTALGNAQIAVIDGANLDVARENAENTSSIMKSNEDILEKSQEILQALSGTRNGSLGIGQQGLGGGMSIASAPSFGSVLNGGTWPVSTCCRSRKRCSARPAWFADGAGSERPAAWSSTPSTMRARPSGYFSSCCTPSGCAAIGPGPPVDMQKWPRPGDGATPVIAGWRARSARRRGTSLARTSTRDPDHAIRRAFRAVRAVMQSMPDTSR